MSGADPFRIEGCQLDGAQLGAQLERYQQLSRHAAGVQRLTGEVRVRFDENLPAGLLERTLEVERGCCPFIHITHSPNDRLLSLTVENINQDPRLDSLFHALSTANAPETQCCEPAVLTTCCEPVSKADCCGTTDGTPPTSCGCGT